MPTCMLSARPVDREDAVRVAMDGRTLGFIGLAEYEEMDATEYKRAELTPPESYDGDD